MRELDAVFDIVVRFARQAIVKSASEGGDGSVDWNSLSPAEQEALLSAIEDTVGHALGIKPYQRPPKTLWGKTTRYLQGRTNEDFLMDFVTALDKFSLPDKYIDLDPEIGQAILQDSKEALRLGNKKLDKAFHGPVLMTTVLAALKDDPKARYQLPERIIDNYKGSKWQRRIHFIADITRDAAVQLAATGGHADAVKTVAYAIAAQPRVLGTRKFEKLKRFTLRLIRDNLIRLGTPDDKAQAYVQAVEAELERSGNDPEAVFKSAGIVAELMGRGGEKDIDEFIDIVQEFEPKHWDETLTPEEREAIKEDLAEALADPYGKPYRGFKSRFPLLAFAMSYAVNPLALSPEHALSGVSGSVKKRRLTFLARLITDSAANLAATDGSEDAVAAVAYALAKQADKIGFKWNPILETFIFNQLEGRLQDFGLGREKAGEYAERVYSLFSDIKNKPD